MYCVDAVAAAKAAGSRVELLSGARAERRLQKSVRGILPGPLRCAARRIKRAQGRAMRLSSFDKTEAIPAELDKGTGNERENVNNK